MFTKKTVKDINLKGRTVLLRADYNVPLSDKGISDTYRIDQSVQTIEYLLQHAGKVIICSHLGRPEGKVNQKFSLKAVAAYLEKSFPHKVSFVDDCVGPSVEKAVKELKPGHILLLENLRFHPEEEKNDKDFAKKLGSIADVFVQDGFGVVHRAHASTDAITKVLPSVAGLLLEKEVDTITEAMHNPKRPLMAIVGGAKIADKIDILNRFLDTADVVAVGGAMANTFLKAKDIDIAKSIWDESELPLAHKIIERAEAEAKRRHFIFYLPQDAVVAASLDKAAHTRIVDWDTHAVADIENYPKRPPRSASDLLANELILDIGPFSGAFIAGAMQMMETVIWNGVMGVTETAGTQGPVGPFAHGTEVVIEAMLGEFGHRPKSLVGGGDTVGYIEKRGLINSFDHASTGGGASLDLMSGKKLPGVEALQDKK
jgi:3-phosphoglycerate kinase